tara:strand:- start:242 stop:535 length:294 start_codon:yes stop_codon:yes gene_type:complete
MLKIIRESNVAPSTVRARGKHHTSDNSSATALKRKIHSRVASQAKKNTLFGDKYSIVAKNAGGAAKQQKSKGGEQGTYLYFKGIFPSMSLNSVTKQD